LASRRITHKSDQLPWEPEPDEQMHFLKEVNFSEVPERTEFLMRNGDSNSFIYHGEEYREQLKQGQYGGSYYSFESVKSKKSLAYFIHGDRERYKWLIEYFQGKYPNWQIDISFGSYPEGTAVIYRRV